MKKFFINRKFLVVLIGLLVCFICLDKILFISVELKTSKEPLSFYKMEINRLTRKLTLNENSYCIDKDCNDNVSHASIILTDEEYSYIKVILKHDYDKFSFLRALSTLVKDDEVMFSLDQEGYDAKDDLNNDGIITYREFGNSYLKILSK